MSQPTSDAPGLDLNDKALDLLRKEAFPHWWTFVPVAGKATFVPEWTSKPLTRERVIELYKTNQAYHGLGVVTGEFSGGLLALDIDGRRADDRFRQVAGDEYDALGEERTMSWTSGKPGRRQLLYRVPASLIPELRHVKTLILREGDGDWHLGQGDMNRGAGGQATVSGDAPYEEVVLRFNACQSVVPGSPHPDTGKRYRWLNYNAGEVALAPAWVLEVLRRFRKPLQWLSDADQKALDEAFGETAVPSRQIRGWFFKEEVQARLMPRLDELVFRHKAFDDYGWKTREGSNPQRMSGCPWHGGQSGTSFQYAVNSGCWDCKACGIGGDVLDFVHKIRSDDMHATRPQGPDLEVYVAELAAALGYDYPACAKAVEVTTKEVPTRRLTGQEFFQEVKRIDEAFENAELGDYYLMELVRDAGLGGIYRSGPQVRAALERLIVQEKQEKEDPNWQANVRGQREYLIPDFMSKPSSIMLHARGGMGKTRLAVLLSKIVGQQLSMKVRGLSVKPTVAGNVLFIGNDMSMTDYAEYFDQQGVDSSGADRWMKFKPYWQQTQYKVLVRWLTEYKPVLVVIDSLSSTSTMIAAKENEEEYANTLYRLARENGTEFPPTTFLWIHHNTKDGAKFRGTDKLRNAVHETWELKALTDEQRAEFGPNALILEIDKSRGMRGGDRFLVREDIEEVLSIVDLTPTVAREDGGQGDERPRTIVLGILKEAAAPMTLKEVRYELNSRLSGRRGPGSFVSAKTTERWVKNWVSVGLVEAVSVRQTGQGRGRPATAYKALSSSSEKTYDEKYSESPENDCGAGEVIFVTGLTKNTPEAGNDEKSRPVTSETAETAQPSQNLSHQGSLEPAHGPSDFSSFSVSEGVVTKNQTPQTGSSTGVSKDDPGFFVTPSLLREESTGTEAPEPVSFLSQELHATLHHGPQPEDAPSIHEDTTHAEAQPEDRQLGEEVPGSQDHGGSSLGNDPAVALGGGRPSDHPAVPEPAPAQAGESQGVVGAGARAEWVIPEDAWETGFDVLGGGSC